jgi:hypothetical protein
MEREISSSLTGFYKLLALFAFCIVLPMFVIGIVIRVGWGGLFVILFWGPFAAIIIWWTLRISKVEIRESGLFISRNNFRRRIEVLVPFENIDYADQHFFQRNSGAETVTIKLKEETELGRTIKFIPKYRPFSFFEHPVVREINELRL